MASFKPAEAPALMLYPQGAELAREAEASRQAGDLPGPLAGLVNEYVEQKFGDGDELRGTLYLNATSPLVRRPGREAAGAGDAGGGLDADPSDGPPVRRANAVGGGRGGGVSGADGVAGEVAEGVSGRSN